MQQFLHRLGATAIILFIVQQFAVGQAGSLGDTAKPTSVDPKIIAWKEARTPKEYTIADIKITGVRYLDTSIVASITNLLPGDKFMHPGTDIFSRALSALWRQKFFSNAQILVTKVEDDRVWLEVAVQERPRLGNFKFVGIKKTEEEDILAKVNLTKQTIITENTRRELKERITKYYAEKAYQNVKIIIEETPDTAYVNSNQLVITIDKGRKMRINDIGFFGNDNVDPGRLKKQMKGTKEMNKLTTKADRMESPYGLKKKYSFSEYIKDWGFLTISRTKKLLDPYFRFKLSGSKYNETKFEEDKNKVLDYYNANGYRDAQIISDTSYVSAKGNLNIDIKVNEGRRYYFGNIVWKGNAKYPDSTLNKALGISKGDVYNLSTLNKRLGKEASQEGGDISSSYMDDGYLFFRAEPIETAVYNDTIDHEIRIIEGPQARIKNVTIAGNERTKDYVIRRELRTIPGELFSRTDLIRSQRELANLQFFNQETINPGVVPNAEDGTVDINWKLEEKSSDQLELSAGWGGGVGLTGTLGVTFNNFSIRNILKKSSWDPLPTGDGQKLSLRIQSNGRVFQSYNFSFTEPWLGGKKRNSFTVFGNKSVIRAGGQFNQNGQFEFSSNSYLKTFSVGVSLGKQLKWPDDFFTLAYSLSFTQYKLNNYLQFDPNFTNGTSNNINAKIAIQRSSVFDPIFPRSGSNLMASVQFTPPYSLFRKGTIASKQLQSYENPEYHKWRFNAEWYVPIGRPMGADKTRQFVMKLAAKYGFMGRYNRDIDYSPFERFQVGDAGLNNNFGLLGFDIIAHRGYPIYRTSNPSINPDDQGGSAQTNLFTIFNKYQLELRFPLVTNPSSTIYALTFFEAANGWQDFKSYNPFKLRRSAGVGMRFFLPMFGLLGFDYGVGIDRITPGGGIKGAGRFTFMLGQEPE